jgi:hypothetical protein
MPLLVMAPRAHAGTTRAKQRLCLFVRCSRALRWPQPAFGWGVDKQADGWLEACGSLPRACGCDTAAPGGLPTTAGNTVNGLGNN